MKSRVVLFWFRRDLRLEDNVGLQQALSSDIPVLPIFIFDTDILQRLANTYDRRVDYIHQALTEMNITLQNHQSALHTYHGQPLEVLRKIIEFYDVAAIYCNRDYEPQAISRDIAVKVFSEENGIEFYDFKDQVIFEKSEIVKADGTPYMVYTPYAKKVEKRIKAELIG